MNVELRWCHSCAQVIREPSFSDITKYASFFRDNRCYRCGGPLRLMPATNQQKEAPLPPPPEAEPRRDEPQCAEVERERCLLCDGIGTIDCDKCNSDREIPCPHCFGRGYFQSDKYDDRTIKECDACHFSRYITCDKCNHYGFVRCPRCHGAGME